MSNYCRYNANVLSRGAAQDICSSTKKMKPQCYIWYIWLQKTLTSAAIRLLHLQSAKNVNQKSDGAMMGSYFFVSIARADIFLGRVETLDSYRLPELLSGGTKNAQTAPLHHLAHHRILKKLLS